MNQNSKDMKRHYFITYMIIMMAILSACYSDNSEEASVEVGNISISGIKEKYSAMSDNGEVLQINPVIKSDYPKKDLEYHWFLYEKSKENAKDYSLFLEDMGYKVFFKNINLNYSVGKVRWLVG